MSHPSHPPAAEIQVASKPVFQGVVVDIRQDEVRLPDGRQSHREVIEHPGGVVVMPILDDGRLLLIRQFRYAINQILIEFPAGKLEKGEDPFDAVKRELLEETGYEAHTWEPLTHIYTAPGFCDERLWLYKATHLNHVEVAQGDGEEHIELFPLTPQEALHKAQAGDITDAKTLSLLLWLQSTST